MLAGRYGRSPVLYFAIVIVVVALVCLGVWSRYHTHQATERIPVHEQK